MGAPAGMAAAADNPADGTEVEADTPAYAVGRDNLHNPAPGLRVAQTLGDQFFNNEGPINPVLNNSPLGQGYHSVFGTRGELEFDANAGVYKYTVGSGEEGLYKGVLNMAPGQTVGNAIPLRECQFENDPASLSPRVAIRAQCN